MKDTNYIKIKYDDNSYSDRDALYAACDILKIALGGGFIANPETNEITILWYDHDDKKGMFKNETDRRVYETKKHFIDRDCKDTYKDGFDAGFQEGYAHATRIKECKPDYRSLAEKFNDRG